MGLREFVELFDKNEVKNLFNALSSCTEYVRIDLHVFNIGAYVTCLYSNDLESLSQTEGCNVNMIIEVPHLFEAFMEYASPEMKLYYSVTDLFGKDCPTKKPIRYGCRQKMKILSYTR